VELRPRSELDGNSPLLASAVNCLLALVVAIIQRSGQGALFRNRPDDSNGTGVGETLPNRLVRFGDEVVGHCSQRVLRPFLDKMNLDVW